MSDLISRQAAKVSITRYFEVHIRNQKSRRLKEHAEEICRDICFGIDAWPSVEPTLYGYRIEDLAFIAGVMAKENMPPEKVIEVLSDAGRVAEMVLAEQKEIMEREVKRWMI